MLELISKELLPLTVKVPSVVMAKLGGVGDRARGLAFAVVPVMGSDLVVGLAGGWGGIRENVGVLSGNNQLSNVG